jgi:hypothetical protein
MKNFRNGQIVPGRYVKYFDFEEFVLFFLTHLCLLLE